MKMISSLTIGSKTGFGFNLEDILFIKKFLRASRWFLLVLGMPGFWSNCLAQEGSEKERAFYPHHEIALAISHALVFEGRNAEGNKEVLSLPAWGIDYSYWFHPKWAIGLQTDIIIEKYEVQKTGENGTEESIERSYPIAPALTGIYKPTEHWAFSLGMGAEFSSEENFALTRIGIEYSGELPKNWEVFGTLSYDIKWNAYDDMVLGIGIAKKFGKGMHNKSKE